MYLLSYKLLANCAKITARLAQQHRQEQQQQQQEYRVGAIILIGQGAAVVQRDEDKRGMYLLSYKLLVPM